MNSTLVEIGQSVIDQIKDNKSFKFVKLYKSAAETTETRHETTKAKKNKKINKNSHSELNTTTQSRSPNKKNKETLDLSLIEAVDYNPSETTRSLRNSSLTSTPNSKNEHLDKNVKSIMKNKSNNMDSPINISNVSSPSSKSKKRNKSVSFMLEDADEILVKKSKSNSSGKEYKNKGKDLKNKEKEANTKNLKQKKSHRSKENVNLNEDIECNNKENVTSEEMKNKVRDSTSDTPINEEEMSRGINKKVKKDKKATPDHEKHADIIENNITGETSSENKSKKLKKKKRKVKSIQDGNTDSAEGEPAVKTRKKDLKPEVIAKGLENLNIGDNAHTLINLLDEMTVVDKNAKKKERQKQKRRRLKKSMTSEDKVEKTSQEKSNIEEKEKVKWSNRKWNKDFRGEGKSRLLTSVIVDNLPIKIMCNYKKLLSEHFSKFGTIAGIGVAEAFPTEDLKPVFTTTVFFQEEEAVTKVLAEDNSVLEGHRVRVRRPLPPTETTLVVRAFGLTDQAVSSLFSAAGRLRSIRQLVKGKKSMPTAFVEFDGPEAVERALKMAEDAKINGKKMYVSKYEIRNKTKPNPSEENLINGSDNDSSTE